MENLTLEDLYNLLNANNLKVDELKKRRLDILASKQVETGRKLIQLIEFIESKGL